MTLLFVYIHQKALTVPKHVREPDFNGCIYSRTVIFILYMMESEIGISETSVSYY